jgi:hypothetical protein
MGHGYWFGVLWCKVWAVVVGVQGAGFVSRLINCLIILRLESTDKQEGSGSGFRGQGAGCRVNFSGSGGYGMGFRVRASG